MQPQNAAGIGIILHVGCDDTSLFFQYAWSMLWMRCIKMYISYKFTSIACLAESFVCHWLLIKVYWEWDWRNNDYILPLKRLLQLSLLLFSCQPSFSSAFHPVWANSAASGGCIQGPPITLSAYPVCQGKSRKKVRVYFLLICYLTEKCI